jgi:hypothetical protein
VGCRADRGLRSRKFYSYSEDAGFFLTRAGMRSVKVAILLVDLKKLSLRKGELWQYLFIER